MWYPLYKTLSLIKKFKVHTNNQKDMSFIETTLDICSSILIFYSF